MAIIKTTYAQRKKFKALTTARNTKIKRKRDSLARMMRHERANYLWVMALMNTREDDKEAIAAYRLKERTRLKAVFIKLKQSI